MTTVPVVDDEAKLVELVRGYLEREDFVVLSASEGPTALDLDRAQRPDVVVLDLMLPGLDGIEVCRRLRQFSDAYVLLLTARTEEIDKIVGLSVGAARTLGEVMIDETRHEVTRRGEVVPLTAREVTLLSTLTAHPGRVYTRDQLLERVWGQPYYDAHAVDVHAANLRKKLEDDPADPSTSRPCEASATVSASALPDGRLLRPPGAVAQSRRRGLSLVPGRDRGRRRHAARRGQPGGADFLRQLDAAHDGRRRQPPHRRRPLRRARASRG
jgi:two-component system, OmpR family, alkaline phosphatase synthesis response regulator PhoP